MNPHRPTYFPASRLPMVLSIIAIFMFVALQVRAQTSGAVSQDYLTRLSGATGTLAVSNTVDLTYPPQNETSFRIKNIVSLILNEESQSYISDSFSVSVTVKVEYGASSASTNSLTQVLTVAYSKSGGVAYNPRNYLSFAGAQYVKLTVMSMSASPSALTNGLDPTTLLILQDEMQVWRTFSLASGDTLTPVLESTPPASSPTPDELPVSWTINSAAGNNGVQLEWTWLEDELAGQYIVGGTINFDLLFKNNSTRVDLPLDATSYNIPLFYDGQGKLYYRVRAVNNQASGTRIDGPWSTPQSFAFSGHNNGLNWQVTTSYAEEGKRKTVMQYFDGSLRQRQTVTKDNTTNTTLTAETFYDGQGRPAIQVLPAPGISTIVAYTQNLNLFNLQTPGSDPAVLFDLQPVSGAGSGTPAMVTTSGAALYYNAANPEVTQGANQNIPDGGGYPYTVTRYTPDATGRIMAQSGVGPSLKMGSTHETKYYYGNAAQEELDGLFGTDAGDFTHYFKNMVQDPNGQMSVSYVDMHGRTIATALAGSAPSHITALDLNATQYPGQAGTTMTRNLLDSNTNTIRNNSIEALTTLLVPVTTAYTFNYVLNPQQLSLTQCGKTVCYDCMYNLEITVTDESDSLPPIIRKFDNINLLADSSCGRTVTPFKDDHFGGAVSTISSNAIQFSETLVPGSYSIRKTLTVNQASLQTFQAQYAKIGLCDSLPFLIDSVYQALLPTSTCNTPPSTTPPCQSCLAALGSLDTFRIRYIATLDSAHRPTDSAIHAMYSADSASCANMCTNKSHLLAVLQSEMLSDMMPYSGQYAKDPTLVTSPGTMYNKYDIFSTAHSGSAFYLNPWTSSKGAGFYLNAAGSQDTTIQPVIGNQSTFISPLTPAIFAGLFTSTWAQALLPHHPEYTQLQFAQQHLAASYDWIGNFADAPTFTYAVDTGGYTTSTGNSETLDSFFIEAPAYKNRMDTLETIGGYYNNLSLWQTAYASVMCIGSTDPTTQDACAKSAAAHPPYSGLTTDQMNQVWIYFKGLYINVRDSMVNDYINKMAPNPDSMNLVNQGYILRFPVTTKQLVTQYGLTGFPTTGGAAPAVSLDDSVIAANNNRCSSYVLTWAEEISQCPALTGNPDSATIVAEITSGMVTVCEKGQDPANPFGSSSVAPATPVDGSARSFADVLRAVFAEHHIDSSQFCNPFVFTFPKPYGENPVLTTENASDVDTCACNQFAKIKTAATIAGFHPDSLSSLNRYLSATYKDTLTQVLFNGLQECSVMGSAPCRTVDSVMVKYLCADGSPCGGGEGALGAVRLGGGIHTDVSVDSCSGKCPVFRCDTIWYIPLTSPQHKPLFLDCGFTGGQACVTCARLSALIGSYKSYFTGQACAAAPVLDTTNLTPAQISYNVTFAQYANYQTGLQLSWIDYVQAATTAGCNLANYLSNGSAMQTVVCPNPNPLNDTAGLIVLDTPCQQRVHDMAVAIAQGIYQQRQAQVLANFASSYSSKCMSARSIEQFAVTYTTSEYHYTLYYYDMAGNLIKTIPPKGARPNFSSTFIKSVDSARKICAVDTPSHLFATNYRYNSLNAVVSQETPDAGVSHFWYDLVGRLAVSQNAQQSHDNNYSYTIYDALGRITEVGQKPQTTAMSQTISENASSLNSWINSSGGTKNQETFTVYDLPVFSLEPMLTQQNLRNRVSFTYTKNLDTDAGVYTASYYTYDVHGNVDTLLQDYAGVSAMASSNQYKRICYNYDLVSGKVNGVDYQPGSSDAFYHRYQYDAENRLVQVLTSRDSIVWERDASYDYYKHGPLSRMILGQLQTQQLDYSYTLQGWLKGVNIGGAFNGTADSIASANAVTVDSTLSDSTGLTCPSGTAIAHVDVSSRPLTGGPPTYTALNSITFEGEFSTGTADEMTAVINPSLGVCTPGNSPIYSTPPGSQPLIPLSYPIGQDAYSFSLHYYPGDYTPIGSGVATTGILEAIPSQAAPLFNGNIAAMAVNNPSAGVPKVYNYHYDQLNRLVQMDAFNGWNTVNNTFTPVQLSDYQERVSYDPNGNIGTYVRHGFGSNIPMDSLTYNYYANNNQLSRINDGAGGSYTTDIKDQGSGNNYTYDLIGNMTGDNSDTSTITWTVYGKIASVATGHNTSNYTYDAGGNRITKAVGSNTTIYVRDAQGNVMSIYQQVGAGTTSQSEVDLFGSSRLGLVGALTVPTSSVTLMGGFAPGTLSAFTRGEKSYELSNHLGNILATITDKKIAVSSPGNSSLIDHFNADVATAQDYYPFGMLMPGRTFTATTAGNYRYGFNGKENDNEVKGTGNQIDYGMRVYDPRAGRFLSVDPLQEDYPWNSPYAFAENDVIRSVDLDGLEKYILTTDRYTNPSTKQPETSRHLYLNPNESQHNRGLIGYYGPDNKMTIIDDPNLLSEFDRKVYDYALDAMAQKNITGGSMRMPTNADIKLKVVETQKVVNNKKPKPKEDHKPTVEESSASQYIYMKPNGNGTPDRNAYAVDKMFKPTVEKLINTLNSKSKDINQIDISITITTNSSNKNQMEDLKNKIQAIYPKAKLDINFDSKYKTPGEPGKAPSDEDFGYKIEAKGYKKQ